MSGIVRASDLLLRAARAVFKAWYENGRTHVGGCTALHSAMKYERERFMNFGWNQELTAQYLQAEGYFEMFMPCSRYYGEPPTFWFEGDVEHRVTALLMARAMALAEGN